MLQSRFDQEFVVKEICIKEPRALIGPASAKRDLAREAGPEHLISPESNYLSTGSAPLYTPLLKKNKNFALVESRFAAAFTWRIHATNIRRTFEYKDGKKGAKQRAIASSFTWLEGSASGARHPNAGMLDLLISLRFASTPATS